MDVPLIEFKDVTKRFGPRTILEHVDLQIYEEQVTTIIGLSGSGKSVLLKHIVGLLKPDEGTILFRGKPFHQMEKKEIETCLGRMSYMFQTLNSRSVPDLPRVAKAKPLLNWNPS
jgi:phospholipid/cholesterol/gamma-HCH transport system ATP-binding protein